MAHLSGYLLMGKRILEGDYQKIREDYKTDIPVTRTEGQTKCLLGGASLYIERIIEANDKEDNDEDLYWAMIYLFMVIDEKKYNLDLNKFEEDTHCVRKLAEKYRPEILRRNT